MTQLASIIILGILAQWLAWKIKVPSILPLIIIGLVVGPLSTLFTEDGSKLLEPIYNVETEKGLFPGSYLFYFVSLAIGVILFEGGLTLRRREISGIGPAILRLITVGSLITFLGAGLAAHFIMGLSWPISFLFGALVIVTGPTVIAPILQNIPLNRNVSTVLKWEGILIDPLGALVAVLVYEFINSSEGSQFTSHAFISFFKIISIGLTTGAIAAYSLYQLIKHELIPHYLLNVFTLALVLGVFVFSDLLEHESGLLAVVVMGMVLANLDVPKIQEILFFKESLSILLISILFILLAAHINMDHLYLLVKDWRGLALFAFIALALRPISVFLSTYGSGLNLREKLFISWVGPRGIVAAGIASLFGITLTNNGVEGAEYITPLVFMIVLGTVLLNATTARPVARLLKVTMDESEGILFIGAGGASRIIGKFLQNNGRHVVLVDNNENNIKKARALGLEAVQANIYTDSLEESFELLDMGYLIAMTSSAEVNQYAAEKYHRIFGEKGTYRLIAPEELSQDKANLPQHGILSYTDDFLNISEAARDYPFIHEVEITSLDQLHALLEKMELSTKSIPIFLKDLDGRYMPVPANVDELTIDQAYALVYLGKEVEVPLVETGNGKGSSGKEARE